MKPYGQKRKDNWSCAYGCCTGIGDKKKNCRKVMDRNRRKTARQEGKCIDTLITSIEP